MPDTPAWKSDFPISWVDDHYVTRREFTKSLVLVSCAAFTATGGLLAVRAVGRRRQGPFPAAKIAAVGDIPVGASKVFRYPTADDPCFVVRLGADRFAAFGQKCTHLGCPVAYRPERNCLYCPCHEGFFDAADGRVLAGPPPRPLPRVELERRGDDLWAIGMSP